MKTCARTGCDKPLITKPPKTMSKAFREWFVPMLAADEYCSSLCCRIDHDCLTKSPTTSADDIAKQMPECGTTAAYHAGCKCDACRSAEAAYQREKRARLGDEARAKAAAYKRARRAKLREGAA